MSRDQRRDPCLPRLAVRLLRATLPLAEQEFVLGDLEEEHGRRATGSRWAAHAWLWKQVLAIVWASSPPDALLRELRFALRALWTRPAFTLTAAATLALGIGPTLAIVSLVRSTLLRPPPFRDPEELVFVWTRLERSAGERTRVALPDVTELRQRSDQLSGLAATDNLSEAALEFDGADPEPIRLGRATPDFFALLGVAPALGSITSDGLAAANGTALVLSDALWRRRFGADAGVVGRSVRLDGASAVVIGVLPADFRLRLPPDVGLPSAVDAWAPLPAGALDRGQARDPLFRDQDSDDTGVVIGRLRSGVTVAQASAELEAIATALRGEIDAHHAAGLHFEMAPVTADGVRFIRPLLLALLAGSILVLGAAALNVMQLLILRGVLREADTHVRIALGASRGRLLLQGICEAGTLGAVGGAIGVAASSPIAGVLLRLAPMGLRAQESDAVGASGTLMVLLITAALVAAMAAGATLPTMRGTRRPTNGRGRANSVRVTRSRGRLVTAQVATAGVLLVGALLLLRTTAALSRVDPGFRQAGAITFGLSLPQTRYRGPADRNRFTETLEDRIAGLPDVEAVGIGTVLPLGGGGWSNAFGLPGEPPESWLANQADFRMVTPGFFAALGVPLLAGRTFTRADDAERWRVTVIDEALADRLAPGKRPSEVVGSRLAFPLDGRLVEAEILGVVGTIRHESLAEPGHETFYVPYRHEASRSVSVVIRAAGNAEALVAPLRRVLADIDPNLPIRDLRTLASYVSDAAAPPRFALLLLAAYGAAAILLCAVGLYGVISQAMTLRRREMGIRLALGAKQGTLVVAVLADGARRTLLGMLLAGALAVPFALLLRRLLFGVTPFDPVAWSWAGAALVLTALIAGLGPARTMSRLDPVDALRGE